MDVFNYGTTVHLETVVRDEDDTATDPTDLTLTYRTPAGVETTVAFAALTNEAGVGVWSYDLAVTAAGTWTWRWVATSPSATDEGTFFVRASAIVGGDPHGTGPCQPWCGLDDLTEGGWTLPTSVSVFLAEQCCQAASEVCFELGGRRWPGLCWDSIIPSTCLGGSNFQVLPNGRGGLQVVTGGSWHPLGCCAGADLLDLGSALVTAVDAVRVDDAAIASTAYRLIDRHYLARLDGDSWPCCNDPAATTIPLEVDFTFGEAPPAIGVLAAVALARELVRGMTSGDDCAIDPRVTALVREGVSIDLSSGGVDASEFLEIPAVRRFVNALNPHGLRRPAAVIVPGQGSVSHRV